MVFRSPGSGRKLNDFCPPRTPNRKTTNPHHYKRSDQKNLLRAFVSEYFSVNTALACLFVFLFLYTCLHTINIGGLKPADLTFEPGAIPVLNGTNVQTFANHPLSSQRPRNQFLAAYDSYQILAKTSAHPILSIITVTKNPILSFRETARFVREQSLRPLKWIIVNDFSNTPGAWKLLEEARELDPRIILLNSTDAGLPQGRVFGLTYLLQHFTKYFIFLDDDDIFELTALEKCVWMLESNQNVSFCGSYVVGFGKKNYTWTRGFHDGVSVYLHENPLTGSEMMRTEVVKSTRCGFNDNLAPGMEDWAFYLCCADKGKWGATIPEFLFWYRQDSESTRKERLLTSEEKEATIRLLRQRYNGLHDRFPNGLIAPSEIFETIQTEPPFTNNLSLSKSIMLIIPWMAIGGGDTANLNIVRELSERGYRVTIVCTLLELHGPTRESMPLFMQYTHDIFFIPATIRLTYAPRFLSYLLMSRSIQTVFLSNSQLGYGLLPWLSYSFPSVKFIDYVHNEEKKWKHGGYAAFSSIHKLSLDRTFSSSEMARKFMVGRGHSQETTEVGYLGIKLDELIPLSLEKKSRTRKQHAIHEDAVVVTFIARMVEHKRPKVALQAFLNATQRYKERTNTEKKHPHQFTFVLIGDGPKLGEVEAIARKIQADVQILGTLGHKEALEYLAISDIFCLPSMSEGLSFALAEAMALGVTPLVSHVGGLPELVKKNQVHGIILPITGDSDTDTTMFADALLELFEKPKFRQYLGKQAIKQVRDMFNATSRIPALVSQILNAPRRRSAFSYGAKDLSSIYYAQENILEELRSTTDFADIQKALAGKERNRYGTKYRATCGEYSEIMTKLIDALEDPVPCEQQGAKVDSSAIQSYAISQCGQWCIMDLSDSSRKSGWQLSESCGGFTYFNDTNHECSKWYKSIKQN